MDSILEDIKKNGIGTPTLDAYLARLRSAINDAYNAGENDQDYVAMVKIGEAKVYLDAVEAVWKELTNK